MKTIEQQCKLAFEASIDWAIASTELKNKALLALIRELRVHETIILEANTADMDAARASGISEALLDRLLLTPERIESMAQGLETILRLNDPIGQIIEGWTRPNGIVIKKTRVPLGVVGIIYEARPNVTADVVGLALKSGNTIVLRGSSSAYRSNRAIVTVFESALKQVGLNSEGIQLLEDTSRESVTEFVSMRQYLSVMIPRGGADLIQRVVKESKVPTIETGVGNCHVFVDQTADLKKAIAIILNGKVQRPSVCNSLETLLIHEAVAEPFLPQIAEVLIQAGVELRGCPKTKTILPQVKEATPSDWETEYLALILAVKVVSGVNEAITHIRQFGTQHSELILSNDYANIELFKRKVDAAAVLVNASTRFVDGSEFGFGAELGISTQKLHARGPMGLNELSTVKYIVEGDGQTR